MLPQLQQEVQLVGGDAVQEAVPCLVDGLVRDGAADGLADALAEVGIRNQPFLVQLEEALLVAVVQQVLYVGHSQAAEMLEATAGNGGGRGLSTRRRSLSAGF